MNSMLLLQGSPNPGHNSLPGLQPFGTEAVELVGEHGRVHTHPTHERVGKHLHEQRVHVPTSCAEGAMCVRARACPLHT